MVGNWAGITRDRFCNLADDGSAALRGALAFVPVVVEGELLSPGAAVDEDPSVDASSLSLLDSSSVFISTSSLVDALLFCLSSCGADRVIYFRTHDTHARSSCDSLYPSRPRRLTLSLSLVQLPWPSSKEQLWQPFRQSPSLVALSQVGTHTKTVEHSRRIRTWGSES